MKIQAPVFILMPVTDTHETDETVGRTQPYFYTGEHKIPPYSFFQWQLGKQHLPVNSNRPILLSQFLHLEDRCPQQRKTNTPIQKKLFILQQ